MYIPIGVLIVLFLINPNLALDILFIGVALYFWPVTLGIIAIIAIVYGITLLFMKIAELPSMDSFFNYLQSDKFKNQISSIKKDFDDSVNFLFFIFLQTLVWGITILAVISVIVAAIVVYQNFI